MTKPKSFDWFWPAKVIKKLREDGYYTETLRDDCHYRTGDYITVHEHDGIHLTGHMIETYITVLTATDKPGIISIRLEEVI